MSPVRGIISWTARVTGATRRLKEAFSLPPGPVYLEQFRVGGRGWAGLARSVPGGSQRVGRFASEFEGDAALGADRLEGLVDLLLQRHALLLMFFVEFVLFLAMDIDPAGPLGFG